MELTQEDYLYVAEVMFMKYGSHFIHGPINEQEKNHIIQVASSVMMTRDNYMQGGSFVQAIVRGDLDDAVNRADAIMRRCLVFMTYIKLNVRAELELEKFDEAGFEKI